MQNIFILTGGFIALIYGAGLLVDSSSSLAKRYNIPDIVIGLTIVAFATSSPELLVSLIASVEGSSEIVMGNVIGSNIFNILFILGISSVIFPLSVKSGTTWIEVPLAFLAGLVVIIMANDVFFDNAASSILSRSDGIIMLLFFSIFMVYNITVMRKADNGEELILKQQAPWKSIGLILLGLILLIAGGKAIVYSSVNIARIAGLSERVIGLTIISIGTSLPEAATSIIAAVKRHTDIAIGNIVGSNIFNLFLILGTSAVISPVPVHALSNFDMEVNLLASLLLFIFIFTGKGRRIGRIEGGIFLLIFLLYLCLILFFKK